MTTKETIKEYREYVERQIEFRKEIVNELLHDIEARATEGLNGVFCLNRAQAIIQTAARLQEAEDEIKNLKSTLNMLKAMERELTE